MTGNSSIQQCLVGCGCSWKIIGKDSVTNIKVNKPLDSTIVKNDSITSTTSNAMPQPPLYYANHDITIHWDVDKKERFTGVSTGLP